MTEPEFMQDRRNHIAQLRARWDFLSLCSRCHSVKHIDC